MRDKILFWIDIGLVHFGIAKFLQEKGDYDLYAIIDVNKGKKFFLNQKLVQFKKVWYYRDYLSKTTKKPNLEYLSSFEEKYKINLWMIAYGFMTFYKYNRYHKFTSNEIISILEQECRFFEGVLDEVKPDFLVIRITDSSNTQLLQQICKARGIKILTLGNTRFGHRGIISSDYDMLDNLNEDVKNHSDYNNKTIEELQQYVKGYSKQQNTFEKKFRTSKIQWLKAALQYLLIIGKPSYRDYYTHYGNTVIRVIIIEILFILKRLYRQFFIDRNFTREITKNEKFVYFPLQLEPERTTLISAPFYSNQIQVIVNIAQSLPIGYKLYVKEHPIQRVNAWRSISDYKEVLDLPNVKLFHPRASHEELLKNCSLVITITGTAGVEAAFHKKPTIVFSDVIYSSIPSVYRLKDVEELPQAIRISLKNEVNVSDLNKFANFMIKNSFEFNDMDLSILVCNRFYYNGLLFDADIPISEMNSFLDENKATFEQLAQEHHKIISQHKKYVSNNN